MTTFKPYPELTLSTEDGSTRITTKGGEDVLGAGRPEDMQRFVDCWNACRKLYAPAAHIEATDARVDKLESLRAEAWSRATALQAELDQRGDSADASTGAEWNYDIGLALRDRRLWLATKCGKLSVTRWNEKRGAWDGLAAGEQPIAWQAYVVPAHPHASNAEGIAA